MSLRGDPGGQPTGEMRGWAHAASGGGSRVEGAVEG